MVTPRAATISDAAQEHHIDRKAMKVLSFLAASPGTELSKEEIFDDVWEGRCESSVRGKSPSC